MTPIQSDTDGPASTSSADGASGDGTAPPQGDDSGGPAPCEADCSTATGAAYTCAAGGCNAAGGACSAAGQGCFCTKDSACASGKCVAIAGQNDVSCGSGCTGSGAADGFGCALVSPGIPTACSIAGFGYTPSNFAPGGYAPPSSATTIDCNTTYNSSAHAFTGWCAGRTAPAIYPNVAQAGGPPADLLAFDALTLASGSTLTLTGGNPVILAVYGAATISGTLDASAHGTTPGAGAAACSAGAGGGGNPGSSNPPGNDPGAAGGGGAGLAAGGGAGDVSTYNGISGNATNGTDGLAGVGGNAHGGNLAVPLIGGCSGGAGASGTSGISAGAGGVGGGGVQLSVAGTISGSGTILTNGATGGAGGVSSPATPHTNGGGGGGGGSAGDILVESASTTSLTLQANGGGGGPGGIGYGVDTTSTNTWPGIPGGNGGTNNGTADVPPANGGPPGLRGQSYTGGGGGGGGSFAWIHVRNGGAPRYGCSTSLAPAPVCDSSHAVCLCVADSDCSSGLCVNAGGRCTGTCSGSGTPDVAGCQAVQSAAP